MNQNEWQHAAPTEPLIIPSAVIYDLESLRPVAPKIRPGKKMERREPGIEYACDWPDKGGAPQIGVSVIALFNTMTNEFRYFLENEMEALHLYLEGLQVDYMVGFNNIGFDDEVLKHTLRDQSKYVHDEDSRWQPHPKDCIGIRPDIPRYDIMRHLRMADMLPPTAPPFVKGYNLENTSQIHGFGGKEMDGALAPILWQQNEPGMRERVIRYCIGDVQKTAQIWNRIVMTGVLRNPVILEGRPVARQELRLQREWLNVRL